MKTLPSWLLLIVSLPTPSATARMRIWRALKALGCVALRDGAYLLPAGAAHRSALQALGDESAREGGSAWLMSVQPRSADELEEYRSLFDRSAEFTELRQRFKQAARGLAKLAAPELSRLLRRLPRELQALQAIDFFPGEASLQAQAAWSELERRLHDLLSPGEPRQAAPAPARLDAAAYQGRSWATRRHLWVDRVASAWLIHRFIDRQARFVWLAKPADCPPDALGFDFDGATFSHAGERVTFETLLHSFSLDADPALARLGAMVRALDTGGEPVAEAQGFEAVLDGARQRLADDDALLAAIGAVLDSLYVHFGHAARRGAARRPMAR